MNPLETRRVQESGRVAEDHPTVACHWRNRPPTAVGHRFGPVADHLAALEQFGHPWMPLELLQHALRIEPRIGVVEPGYESEGDDVVFGTVDPGAAVLSSGERPSHGVHDLARGDTARGHFPQLFDSNSIG